MEDSISEQCDQTEDPIHCFDRIGSTLHEFLELVPVDDESAVQFATVLARTTEDIINTDHIRSFLPPNFSDYKKRSVTFPAYWCQYHNDPAAEESSQHPLAHFRCLRELVKMTVYSIADAMDLTNRSTAGRRGHPPHSRTPSHTDRKDIAFSLWALYQYTIIWIEEIGNPA